MSIVISGGLRQTVILLSGTSAIAVALGIGWHQVKKFKATLSLVDLVLSSSLSHGTASSGTLIGALAGSTFTLGGTPPAGLTIASTGGTYSWDGTGSGTGTFTITESNAGAIGSPHTTTINYSIGAGAGTSAPVLSSPSASVTGPTTASLGVTTDTANGTLYWVVSTSSTAPTATQIAAGQDSTGAAAVSHGSQAVSASGAQSASATGLTASTTYYAFFMHTNASSQQSNVSASASFTPVALATPTLTNSSALGTAPLVLAWSDTDYVVGLYGQLQIATDSAFSSITQNLIFFIDGASVAKLDENIGLNSPAGLYYARIRTCRDNEAGATTVTGSDPSGNAVSFTADVSAWSATFSDTINVTTTVLDSTKRCTSNATISSGTYGANTRITGIDQNTEQNVGTTNSIPDGAKYYCEAKITVLGSPGMCNLGITDDTFAFASTLGAPPLTSKGAGTARNSLIYPSQAHSIPTEATGNIMQMVAKRTGTSVKVWIGINNTWYNGDPSAETGGDTYTLQSANCYGYFSVNDSVDTFDINFGQAAFTYAKPTGATAWS